MVKVLIANDSTLISHLLTTILNKEPDIEVVGTAQNFTEVLNATRDFDMLLVDSSFPERGAMAILEHYQIRDQKPKVIVLGLGKSTDQILEYIQAGADGYLLEKEKENDLIQCILMTSEDRPRISPEIAEAMMNRLMDFSLLLAEIEDLVSVPADLTSREWEVLRLLAEGLTNRDIADQLKIALGTTKNHIHSIYQKLNIRNRHQAAVFFALSEEKKYRKIKS